MPTIEDLIGEKLELKEVSPAEFFKDETATYFVQCLIPENRDGYELRMRKQGTTDFIYIPVAPISP